MHLPTLSFQLFKKQLDLTPCRPELVIVKALECQLRIRSLRSDRGFQGSTRVPDQTHTRLAPHGSSTKCRVLTACGSVQDPLRDEAGHRKWHGSSEPARGTGRLAHVLINPETRIFIQANLFCHLNIPLKAKHAARSPAAAVQLQTKTNACKVCGALGKCSLNTIILCTNST